ncbi:NADH-quinone oxidoreductase subunit C [Streptomyces shaanxiensis]|uniref:NADH-quinone oxidoreductase subunit C n=1 Tax=Streptomyces shaanxiensis TaxID=653357 RepID=A0ABP7VGT9_9ACTN
MTTIGWLPTPVEDLFGPEATAEESYEVLTVDVPPTSWIAALRTARDELGCTYFDWLSAVDEPGTGFRVAAHIAALSPVRRLLLRTTVPHESPTLPSAIGVYAGAAWHERETHEMFGVLFADHPALDHLLLPENFEGHPLRKDFVLAARVAKAWPGAKEPGESEHGGPKRRQMLPPGVPDPNEWGPLKGQLPPAPARPARGAARAAGERPARAAGERPVRRTRTAAEGSASQAGESAAGASAGASAGGAVRRARTAAEGSASQTAAAGTEPATETGASRAGAGAEQATSGAEQTTSGAESNTSATASPTSGTEASPRRARTAGEGSASQRAEAPASPASPMTGAAEADGAGDGQGTAVPSTTSPTTPSASPTRRSRSVSEGSASQRPGAGSTPTGPRRSRSASEGSASQQAASDTAASEPAASATAGSEAASADAADEATSPATPTVTPKPPTAPRSPDAPWHHARPAFDKPEPKRGAEREPEPDTEAEPEPDTEGKPEPDAEGESVHETGAKPSADPTAPTNPTDPAGGPQ